MSLPARDLLPAITTGPAVGNHAEGGIVASCSRRGFLSASATAILATALASCGGGGDDSPTGPQAPPPPPGSVTFSGGVLTVNLDLVPSLTATNGHLIVGLTDATGARADVILINPGGAEGIRSFSSICTHEGCTVAGFSNRRIVCVCHGSEFDTTGAPVAGPAPRALKEFRTTVNTVTRVATVTVS